MAETRDPVRVIFDMLASRVMNDALLGYIPEASEEIARYMASALARARREEREACARERDAMRAALEWYAEHGEGCRKIGRVGDPSRHALDADGGERARKALAAIRDRSEEWEACSQCTWRVRETADCWLIEAELPCINGLAAWFSLGRVRKPDASEMGHTDGAIEGVVDALLAAIRARTDTTEGGA